MGNFAENLNLGNRFRPPLTVTAYCNSAIYLAYYANTEKLFRSSQQPLQQATVTVLGGGHSHWKVVRGCDVVMTPFLRPVGTPLPSNLPSMRRSCAPPPFFNFWIFRFLFLFVCLFVCLFLFFFVFVFVYLFFIIFSLVLAKIWDLWNQSCQNFRSKTLIFQENPLFRPFFWKSVWHTPTKKKKTKQKQKKVECPPDGTSQDQITFIFLWTENRQNLAIKSYKRWL